MILVVFGLPGVGKTYVSNILNKEFGFFVYEADEDMQKDLKDAIVKGKVTDQLRDIFFIHLIKKVQQLSFHHKKIVVSQTFIKEKYREQFMKAFPKALFILIDAESNIREHRLMTRNTWQLSLEQWRYMSALFEDPKIKHFILKNNDEGEKNLRQYLRKLLTANSQ